MAKNPAPAPASNPDAPSWTIPKGDQEFVFENIQSAPAWVDRNWASFSQGPALALPVDIYGDGPYTTLTARVGDTVYFKAATPSKPAHFEVIAGEPVGDQATKKIPQVTNASLEDMLKTGVMTPDDLGEDAKGQVIARSPKLKGLIEDGDAAPKAVPVTDIVKTS
jgi:hypothetical protein